MRAVAAVILLTVFLNACQTDSGSTATEGAVTSPLGVPPASADTTSTPTSPLSAPTTSRTSSSAPAPSVPPTEEISVTSFHIEDEIPLRVLAVRSNNTSLAVIDFEAGTTTVYPPGTHSAPGGADGAVMTPSREWILWQGFTAERFPGTPHEDGIRLAPENPWSIPGIAPALRVVPSPDGDRVWIVQPGLTYADNDWPTILDLLRSDGDDSIIHVEADGDAFPVAATEKGLVLNTSTLFDTGDGWAVRPGSEEVIHVLDDGTTVPVGDGVAIAASPTRIARLVCPRDGDCSLPRGNDLVISNPDGSGEIVVSKEFEGTWFDLGGPGIPSDAMPLQTVSPDGTELLVGLGRRLDANNQPRDSVLFTVDLETGETREVGESEAQASWSADGRWIATYWGSDITLIDSTDPQTTIRFEDIVPEEHFVLAAG